MARTDTSRRPLAGFFAIVAVMAAVAACGSDAGGAGAAPPAAAATSMPPGPAAAGGSAVEITNFMFMPQTLTVAVGTTVTWKFDDPTQHTVNADDKSFSSPPMAGGQTFTHTFGTAGTVRYHCSIHPFMTGTIVVK